VALVGGMLDQAGEQRATQAMPLPIVGDCRGDLDHAGLAGDLDVADDGDTVAGGGIDRQQRLAVVVIDVK
jgi:hypothetical protein